MIANREMDGARVVDDLAPENSDMVVAKKTYLAFYNTELDSVLKKWKFIP